MGIFIYHPLLRPCLLLFCRGDHPGLGPSILINVSKVARHVHAVDNEIVMNLFEKDNDNTPTLNYNVI